MGWRSLSVGMNLAAVALGMAALAATLAFSAAFGSDVGDLLTRNTVRLSLVWYAAAVCLMLFLTPTDWAAGTVGSGTTRTSSARAEVARWCWTWGLICFLVHLAMAFHYFHHWSHAHAFERTRQVARVGEGIYVSYLFTVLWGADVAYWWLRPERYASRSPWIDRSLHAFMLFIVLNGTVVFESGPIRWAGLLGLAVLAVAWWVARGGRRSRRTGHRYLAERV
jgi:hypothetical protein